MAPGYRAIVVLADLDGNQQVLGGETVFEEAEPVRTGLLNAAGVPLYRYPQRHPIGFDLTKTRA